MAGANKTCHFKLVLLGDTAVGKSCLVVRFVRDEFFEFQEPTIGGEYLFVTCPPPPFSSFPSHQPPSALARPTTRVAAITFV